MADIGRAASHQAALGTTAGWSEVDQALSKLDVRSDKDKHVRALAGQTDLHVHDSNNWHGISSPKDKYGEAVRVIKAAIDRDFGTGAGDQVFHNIGIKSDSDGLKLKQIAALRQEVAQLGEVGSFDANKLKAKLDGVNNPKIPPENIGMAHDRRAVVDGEVRNRVTVSGQMRRDFGTSDGYKLTTGDRTTSDPREVARQLDELTNGNASHLLALSKFTSQTAPIALLAASDVTSKLMVDAPKASINFAAERTGQGYKVSIDYAVPVKGKQTPSGGIEMADPGQSRLAMRAEIHIPFDAIANGNIDWQRVAFDPGHAPGYALSFHPE